MRSPIETDIVLGVVLVLVLVLVLGARRAIRRGGGAHRLSPPENEDDHENEDDFPRPSAT